MRIAAGGQRSLDDLGTPLCDVTFCVLDIETTGSDRGTDLITEIGMVKVRAGECLGTLQSLVNPGKAIPSLARCAEYGKMLVRGGKLSHPGLERF